MLHCPNGSGHDTRDGLGFEGQLGLVVPTSMLALFNSSTKVDRGLDPGGRWQGVFRSGRLAARPRTYNRHTCITANHVQLALMIDPQAVMARPLILRPSSRRIHMYYMTR